MVAARAKRRLGSEEASELTRAETQWLTARMELNSSEADAEFAIEAAGDGDGGILIEVIEEGKTGDIGGETVDDKRPGGSFLYYLER